MRKFADDQGFDVGTRGFFVIEIGPDVADVRIGQADDLAGIAGIAEDLLIAGKTGIENDFAAAARSSASRPAVKDAPVFERQGSAVVLQQVQGVLPEKSFYRFSGDFADRTEAVDRPIGENGLAVNIAPRHRTKDP